MNDTRRILLNGPLRDAKKADLPPLVLRAMPAANAADSLIKAASRFPVRPRGKMMSRDAALALASCHVATHKKAGDPPEVAMKKAARKLHTLAEKHGYDPCLSEHAGKAQTARYKACDGFGKRDRKALPGVAFVSDIEDLDTTAALAHKVAGAAGLGKAGKGNRANHRQIGEMVRALSAIRRAGLALPTPNRFTAQHLQCPDFVKVLIAHRLLAEDEFDVDHFRQERRGQLRDLAKAAAHRIGQAVAVLSK